jgi:hypothetical protein
MGSVSALLVLVMHNTQEGHATSKSVLIIVVTMGFVTWKNISAFVMKDTEVEITQISLISV